ncbi:Septin-10 [Paramicrosporidium saccamoebae]|uniref:Septin-10 n=1 Tax=Paramicrosporidium saccamoebae TaxID=1246581 RepID=A0A2H9TJC3_9FUNG|nr:Septin-10 [Paramicrosporidium saccamoebae]
MSSALPSGPESSTYTTAVLSSQVCNVGISYYPNYHLTKAREETHRLNLLLLGTESDLLTLGAPGTGKATLLNTLLHGTVVPTTRSRDADDFQVATYCGTQQEGNVAMDVEISEILGYGSDRLADKTYSLQIVELLKQRHQMNHQTERSRVESVVPQTADLIHAVLYFVPPTFMQFSAGEIALFKDMQQLTLVVPVISKADIYTAAELKDKKLLVPKYQAFML